MDQKQRSRLLRAFARALRDWRISSDFSQEQLAHEGLNRSHVSALESGETDPKLTTLFELARILDVRPSVFMREIERNYGDNSPPGR